MADIEFTDGSSFDFDKKPGETLTEFHYRTAAESDAQYERLKRQATDMGFGGLFDGFTISVPNDT